MNAGSTPLPRFGRWWLLAAGIYNLLWGAWVIAAPHAMFDLAGMNRINYPEIWQCVGMIVGVYGVGYLAAASDHRRHWPIVLVGLLGKIFGPIGFAVALWKGVFPPIFALTIVTNDLIWWIPFAMMLWDAAWSAGAYPPAPPSSRSAGGAAQGPTLAQALDSLSDQQGRTLRALSDGRPLLVVFLRHAGCTFCREALDDLARQRARIEGAGVGIAVVTMSDASGNAALARRYGLEGAAWFSDPDRVAYRAFELGRGGFAQVLGPRVWWRGLVATLRGHLVGPLAGDGFQMPGAFIIHRGAIVRGYRHALVSDRPAYDQLACELPAVAQAGGVAPPPAQAVRA